MYTYMHFCICICICVFISGWPSFRDEEVIWENVRSLHDGETVSIDGTHLGHNLPDADGNRYCINLVSVAGYPNNNSTFS